MSDEKQRLPDYLAKLLPEEERKALQNPSRRQILRELGDGDQRRSLSELTREGPVPCSLSCANYHVRLLREVELVTQVGSDPVEGSVKHYFSSAIRDGSPVLVVLRATEQSDHHHLGLSTS